MERRLTRTDAVLVQSFGRLGAEKSIVTKGDPFLLSLVPPPSPGSGFLYFAYTFLGITPGVLATP
jgi:hypothetical protein